VEEEATGIQDLVVCPTSQLRFRYRTWVEL
jgi:hypothetical protein